MKKLALFLSVLLITLSGGTLQAMDSTLEDRVVRDAVTFFDSTDAFYTARKLYESKHAESIEYKTLLLRHLFILHAHMDYKFESLMYLCQQIDLIDSNKSQITFGDSRTLAALVQHQSHNGHGGLKDINALLLWCIGRGATLDGDSYSISPLAIAINIAHRDVVQLLLHHNADVYRVVDGQTLLDFAHITQQQVKTYSQARKDIKDAGH